MIKEGHKMKMTISSTPTFENTHSTKNFSTKYRYIIVACYHPIETITASELQQPYKMDFNYVTRKLIINKEKR